jgi:hypothetical protein
MEGRWFGPLVLHDQKKVVDGLSTIPSFFFRDFNALEYEGN